MTADRIEPCPNRECLSGDAGLARDEGWDLLFLACPKCGVHGPGVPCHDESDMDAVRAEARRLWNCLPRGASATDFL